MRLANSVLGGVAWEVEAVRETVALRVVDLMFVLSLVSASSTLQLTDTLRHDS